MTDEPKDDMITRLDHWIHKHPTLDGIVAGATVGSVIGPLGTVAGALAGPSIAKGILDDEKDDTPTK